MRKEIFLPISKMVKIGADPSDSEETQLQKLLLVIGALLIITATAIWGIVYILFQEPVAAAISFFYSTITLISIFIFNFNRKHRWFLSSQLVLGLFLPTIQMLVLGGFMHSSAVNLWSMIIPLGAMLLYGTKRAIKWWLAFLLVLLLGGFLQPFTRESNNLPPALINSFFVMNIAAVSGIVFITLNQFIKLKEEAFRLLKIEEEKAENLLLNILPKEIAAILKNENRTIADQFDGASILFADLVGFTPLTAQMSPVEMVNLLNEIFSHFDSLVEKYQVEKIRTIGDNYMVAAGVPRPRSDHALVLAKMALDMNDYIQNFPSINGQQIEFRIGINSGPVVGGVIGRKKFVYDLWGDAVNIASRMESQGVPRKIQITGTTYQIIKDRFICEQRGMISVKGRGEQITWFLLDEKPNFSDSGQI